jgi:hypothetical protein
MLAGSSSVFRVLPVSVAGSAAEAEVGAEADVEAAAEAAAVAGDDPEAGDDAAAGGVVLELPPQPPTVSTAKATSPAKPTSLAKPISLATSAPRSPAPQFCDLSRENTTKPSGWRANYQKEHQSNKRKIRTLNAVMPPEPPTR